RRLREVLRTDLLFLWGGLNDASHIHLFRGLSAAVAKGNPVAIAAYVLLELISLAAFVGFVAARPISAFFRKLGARRLRRTFVAMPADQRAGVLEALHADPVAGEDARKILAPLLREFPLRGEVAPAARPSGRGDEATPVEGAP